MRETVASDTSDTSDTFCRLSTFRARYTQQTAGCAERVGSVGNLPSSWLEAK
jgi:hypothetical protein